MIKLPFSTYSDLSKTVQKSLDKHLIAQTKPYYQELVNLLYGACVFAKYPEPYEVEKYLCKFMPQAMMEECTFFFLEHIDNVEKILPNIFFIETLIQEDSAQEENNFEHLTSFLTALETVFSTFKLSRDSTYDFAEMDEIYKKYMRFLGNFLKENMSQYEHFLIKTRGDEFARYFPH